MTQAPKDNKLRIAVYSILAIILIIAVYYYYTFLKQRSDELDQATTTTITKSLAGKKLETQVLKDKKFKELEKIVVDQSFLQGPSGPASATSTGGATSTQGQPEDLASIPRHYGNPFKPF